MATPPLKNLYVGASGVIWALDVLRRRGLAETGIDLAAAASEDARGVAGAARLRAVGSGARGGGVGAPDRRERAADRRVAARSEHRARGRALRARARERRQRGGRDHVRRARDDARGAGDARVDRGGALGRGVARERRVGLGGQGRGRPLDEPALRRDVPQPHGSARPRRDRARSQAGCAAGAARARDRPKCLPGSPCARTGSRTGRRATMDGPACSSSGAPVRPESSRAPRPTSTRSSCSPGPSWSGMPARPGWRRVRHLPRDGRERPRVHEGLRAHRRRAWLERARRFAMHALGQVERRGLGRYSLWTGDVGVALYAADCIDGASRYPVLESWG